MAPEMLVDISYVAPHGNEIVDVALHREFSSGILFV
jgi:hypothetical protein